MRGGTSGHPRTHPVPGVQPVPARPSPAAGADRDRLRQTSACGQELAPAMPSQAHPAATARRTGGLPGPGAVPRPAGARPRRRPNARHLLSQRRRTQQEGAGMTENDSRPGHRDRRHVQGIHRRREPAGTSMRRSSSSSQHTTGRTASGSPTGPWAGRRPKNRSARSGTAFPTSRSNSPHPGQRRRRPRCNACDANPLLIRSTGPAVSDCTTEHRNEDRAKHGGSRRATPARYPLVVGPQNNGSGAEPSAQPTAMTGVQIGRDDERSSDTRLASVVSRWLGRNVGAWDPA